MIYCIIVTCHCNTVKLVKAHTNEYLFLHTFGFHKNCSAWRERERERETDNYVVMEKKLSGDAGDRTQGLSHAPLSYITILEDKALKKYYIHLFTVAHYFVVMIRVE